MATRHVKVFASVEQFFDQADSASKNLCRVKGIVKWIGKPRPGTGQYEGHTYRSLAITDTQDHEALELKCVFKDAETKRIDNLDGKLITVQGYCNKREGIKYLNSAKLILDFDTAAPQATANAEENSREDSIMRQSALKGLGHLAQSFSEVKPLMTFIDTKILPWFKGQETDPFEDD